MKKYWHEVLDEAKPHIRSSNITMVDFLDSYKRPDWCGNGGALEGLNGCSGLLQGIVKSKAHCGSCSYCIK